MHKADTVRLRHMLDAAREAIRFAAGRRRSDLDKDRQLVFSLVKALEIVGEAASQASCEARQENPQLPWQDMIGMRHRLVHAYYDINLDILWRTLQEDLPTLIETLEAIPVLHDVP